MKNFIIKNGSFVDKETGEATSSIHGVLTKVATVVSEAGIPFLLFTLGSGDEASILKVKRYGDAALKLLRCLYNIVDRVADAEVVISLDKEEGHRGVITITFDNEELRPLGPVEFYLSEKKLITDKIVGELVRATGINQRILVFTNSDDVVPTEASEIAESIRAYRREGKAYTCKKHSFSNIHALRSYLDAVRDLGGTRYAVIMDETQIDAIWLAHVEVPGDDDEEA